MKKALSIILVLVMSLAAFCSCQNTAGTSTTAASATGTGEKVPDSNVSEVKRPEHTTPVVDYSANAKVELVNNGTVIFNYNYNSDDNASARTVEALNELANAICNRSLGTTDATAENVFAIINTRADYPSEFKAYVDKMGDGDYMVYSSDDIIVVAGNGDENLWIAANFFAKNLMGYDCENPTDIANVAILAVPSGVEYIAEDTHSTKYDTLTIDGVNVRDFVVVCPDEFKRAGEALVRYIGLKSGYEPKVFADEQGKVSEIVFVKDESLAANEYKCSASGGKVVLSAANATTASLAAYKFIDAYVGFNGSGASTVTSPSFDEKAAFDFVDSMTKDYTSLIMNTFDTYYSVSVDTEDLAELLAIDNGIDYMDKSLYDYTSSNKTYSMTLEFSEGVSISLKRKISTAKGTDITTVKLVVEDGKLPCFDSVTVKNIISKSFSEAEHSGTERIVLNTSYAPCECDVCKGTYESYFKLVNEIVSTTPDVSYTLLAYNATITPPSFKLSSNVSVDFFPTKACCSHALADASCEINKAISDSLKGWTEVCDHVNLYDTTNDYSHFPSTFPNFDVLGKNAAFYKSLALDSVSYIFSPELTSREFGVLREYIINSLLMNAGMTDAEYEKMFDDAVDALYGIAADNIRKYIDLFAYEASDHYTVFDKPSDILAIPYTVDADGTKQYDVKLAAKLYNFLYVSQYGNSVLESNKMYIAKLVYYAYQEDCDYYITHMLPQYSEWFQCDIDTLDRTRVANEILAEIAK